MYVHALDSVSSNIKDFIDGPTLHAYYNAYYNARSINILSSTLHSAANVPYDAPRRRGLSLQQQMCHALPAPDRPEPPENVLFLAELRPIKRIRTKSFQDDVIYQHVQVATQLF